MMVISLSETDSLACFFHDDRLVHKTVRDRDAALLPEVSPPSEDVLVEQRYVQGHGLSLRRYEGDVVVMAKPHGDGLVPLVNHGVRPANPQHAVWRECSLLD
ncbi:hypothetical protein MRS44_018376 [Fusarium solani]|uniref:uncharacterized protein n=1 Tax=Fusarium solani TaxID=169388 RepID=UPI0032C4210A|nr:hypothetical protein MRS44_018376 [Fusarium solani]